jgi:4-hydroxy 2-oxovalerate aldolase
MLGDSRFIEEDILAAIEHLRVQGGKKFSLNTLDAARSFYQGAATGHWRPASVLEGKEVLILGTGPGVSKHRLALGNYIKRNEPVVIALNTQSTIDADLIDLRVACHPVRLLADCEAHTLLPQPLVTPASMLPKDVRQSLDRKELLDFGLVVEPDKFEFDETHCVLPSSLVVAYSLAVATSGKARQILMAGFDGYPADDPRTKEMQSLLDVYVGSEHSIELIAVTPTRYSLSTSSIYAM